jgi:DNA repair protein RecO (recombination protein O)
MKPRSYTSEGIVLARRNYGEADRILVVFSKAFGKISLIAKGVRYPKSRKRGAIEVFSHIKFAAVAGKNLDLITEAEIIDTYNPIRRDLKRASLAYFFMEAIGRTLHEGEQNMEIYKLLIEYLNKLKIAKMLKRLRLDFILKLLTLEGFWPEGKPMENPDGALEEVTEREMNSFRVGKKLLS